MNELEVRARRTRREREAGGEQYRRRSKNREGPRHGDYWPALASVLGALVSAGAALASVEVSGVGVEASVVVELSAGAVTLASGVEVVADVSGVAAEEVLSVDAAGAELGALACTFAIWRSWASCA